MVNIEVISKTKRWGGSMALIIPEQVVEAGNLSFDQEVSVNIEPVGDLTFLWGKGKHIKVNTQEILDEIDEGWK